jgi:hypothetical protein
MRRGASAERYAGRDTKRDAVTLIFIFSFFTISGARAERLRSRVSVGPCSFRVPEHECGGRLRATS